MNGRKPDLNEVKEKVVSTAGLLLEKTMILKEHPEGKIETGDIALPVASRDLLLPCGIYGRWERK